MNYDLKIYGMLGLDAKHIETIDKIYGSVIDTDFEIEDQPKRIRNIIRRLAELPTNLRPKFIFESSVAGQAKKFKNLAHGVLTRKDKKHK